MDVRKTLLHGRVAPERPPQILQDMKTVGDLPRLGCAFLRPLRKRTAVIAADDLDARMSLEPVCSHAYGAFPERSSTSRSTMMVP